MLTSDVTGRVLLDVRQDGYEIDYGWRGQDDQGECPLMFTWNDADGSLQIYAEQA